MKIGQKVRLNKKGFDEEVAVGQHVHNFLGCTTAVCAKDTRRCRRLCESMGRLR